MGIRVRFGRRWPEKGVGEHSNHSRTKHKSDLKRKVALPLGKHPLRLSGGISQIFNPKRVFHSSAISTSTCALTFKRQQHNHSYLRLLVSSKHAELLKIKQRKACNQLTHGFTYILVERACTNIKNESDS